MFAPASRTLGRRSRTVRAQRTDAVVRQVSTSGWRGPDLQLLCERVSCKRADGKGRWARGARRKVVMMDRKGRLYGFLVVACAVTFGALAGSAWASDQFTLDSQPDSFGAIVTDAAGDAYIAWNHKANPADVPTFCRLASGAPLRARLPGRLALPAVPPVAVAAVPGHRTTAWCWSSPTATSLTTR